VFDGDIDMSSSFFDVYNCPDDEVTQVWVDVEEGTEVDFSYGVGDLCTIFEDVWVSPSGSDEDNLGTSEPEAFLTVERALEMIAPEDDDPITINLTGGTVDDPDIFAPSTTGEQFPIIMISNVNLIGQGEEVTIIDAEQTGTVISMDDSYNNIISDLTITGGYAEFGGGIHINNLDYQASGNHLSNQSIQLNNLTIRDNAVTNRGGGIYIFETTITLNNVIIKGNTAGVEGGGMSIENYWHNNNNDGRTLNNVTIINNYLTWGSDYGSNYGGGLAIRVAGTTLNNMYIGYNGGPLEDCGDMNNSNPDNPANQIGCCVYGGGGIYLQLCNPTLTNVTIESNIADYGGGIYLDYSYPTLTNVTITNNWGWGDGGGMNLVGSHPLLKNVTIANNRAWWEISGSIAMQTGCGGNGCDDIETNTCSHVTIMNSIIWGNTPHVITDFHWIAGCSECWSWENGGSLVNCQESGACADTKRVYSAVIGICTCTTFLTIYQTSSIFPAPTFRTARYPMKICYNMWSITPNYGVHNCDMGAGIGLNIITTIPTTTGLHRN
jgi:hypothetical protein